jgi:hypothetical protein
MYTQGAAIAYSAPNRFVDLSLTMLDDFFRSLSRMAVL